MPSPVNPDNYNDGPNVDTMKKLLATTEQQLNRTNRVYNRVLNAGINYFRPIDQQSLYNNISNQINNIVSGSRTPSGPSELKKICSNINSIRSRSVLEKIQADLSKKISFVENQNLEHSNSQSSGNLSGTASPGASKRNTDQPRLPWSSAPETKNQKPESTPQSITTNEQTNHQSQRLPNLQPPQQPESTTRPIRHLEAVQHLLPAKSSHIKTKKVSFNTEVETKPGTVIANQNQQPIITHYNFQPVVKHNWPAFEEDIKKKGKYNQHIEVHVRRSNETGLFEAGIPQQLQDRMVSQPDVVTYTKQTGGKRHQIDRRNQSLGQFLENPRNIEHKAQLIEALGCRTVADIPRYLDKQVRKMNEDIRIQSDSGTAPPTRRR